MALKNQLTTNSKPKFSEILKRPQYQTFLQTTLGDPKRVAHLTTALTSWVATNPALQDCDASTILAAALLGESLHLAHSPQLGQYYLVPFNDTKNNRKVCTFIVGYRGMYQLAIRSGYYKKINVTAVKACEYVNWDEINKKLEVNHVTYEERKNSETVGYYAMYELINGYTDAAYMTKAEMEDHALTYSKGYAAKKGYTFWEKDFDAMAEKTMLRKLLKLAPMSTEMITAYEKDTAIINKDGEVEYFDAPSAGDASDTTYTSGTNVQDVAFESILEE